LNGDGHGSKSGIEKNLLLRGVGVIGDCDCGSVGIEVIAVRSKLYCIFPDDLANEIKAVWLWTHHHSERIVHPYSFVLEIEAYILEADHHDAGRESAVWGGIGDVHHLNYWLVVVGDLFVRYYYAILTN
jgi:hypothetical protein